MGIARMWDWLGPEAVGPPATEESGMTFMEAEFGIAVPGTWIVAGDWRGGHTDGN
jgi:hypothetical protein